MYNILLQMFVIGFGLLTLLLPVYHAQQQNGAMGAAAGGGMGGGMGMKKLENGMQIV